MNDLERLLAKGLELDCGYASPCYVYQEYCTEKGYGQFHESGHNGRPILAHIWMYKYFEGPLEDGICVLHHCDNPPCFRFDHLFQGTREDNFEDMRLKLRASHNRGTHPNQRKVFCVRNHLLEADNVRVDSRGWRHCRKCDRENYQKFRGVGPIPLRACVACDAMYTPRVRDQRFCSKKCPHMRRFYAREARTQK